MKIKYTALVATLIVCGTLPSLASAQSMPDLKFSGFGTLAAVHSNDPNSDFIGTLYQPNGAGRTSRTSYGTDSKLGGQLSATFNDKLSAVLQVISQHQPDNTWTPKVEWANLKYQITPALSARIGRIAAPSYLLSESRYVGYSMPWARAPQEAYSVLSITSNDGVDATWRSQIGSVNNTVQVFYGKSEVKFGTGRVKGDPNWGINDTLEVGSLTLRVGYNSLKYDLATSSVAPLFGAMKQLGLTAIAEKYDTSALSVSALALGATYDPGNWFVSGEYIGFKGQGLVSDTRSWYVSGGYRFGAVTPYLTRSGTRPSIKQETAAGPLNGGINATLYGFAPSQDTTTFGVRWDFMTNVALKAQYDHISTVNDKSAGRFRTYPGFVKGSSVNLMTVAVDFVF